jgi:hypothetical protein
MVAGFIFLGLIFGASLGYLALAALRAAKSTNDETTPIVPANAANPSLGDDWERVHNAFREYSSKKDPNIPL